MKKILKHSFYNRESPLLERKHVPFEFVQWQEEEATGPRSNAPHKRKEFFTLRVLKGHRPISQSDGANERSIRLEISDEYNQIKNDRILHEHAQNCFQDSIEIRSDKNENVRLQCPNNGPINVPAFQQQANAFQRYTHFDSGHCDAIRRVEEAREECMSIDHKCEVQCIHLYELEVGESDFAKLRQDQTLLVEFSDFSKSLIDLLMQCDLGKSGQGEDIINLSTDPSKCETLKMNSDSCMLGKNVGRFRCRVEDFSHQSKSSWNKRVDSSARFSIIESNQFRELVHLSLNIEKGTDATIRSYLSTRLYENIGLNAMLKFHLRNEKEKSYLASKAHSDISQEYNKLASTSERERNALVQKADESIQKESSTMREELQMVITVHEDNMRKLKEEMGRRQNQLQNEIDKISVENENLKVVNKDIESAHSSLKARFIECGTKFESSRDEIKHLKREINQILIDRDNLDRNLKQSRSFIANLEASNEQYESSLEKSKHELEAAGAIAAQARQEVDGYLRQLNSLKLELSKVQEESAKSKELLFRYQRDRQEMKRRMKSKVKLIQKQEGILSSREIESTETTEKLVESDIKCAQLQQELEVTKAKLAEAEMELVDNKKILNSNQQVISWLNKEANITQKITEVPERKFGNSLSNNIGMPTTSNLFSTGGIHSASPSTRFNQEYMSPMLTSRTTVSHARCASRKPTFMTKPNPTSQCMPQIAPTPTPSKCSKPIIMSESAH